MLSIKRSALLAAAILGLSIQLPVSADSVETEIQGNTSTKVSKSYRVKFKTIGHQQLVTKRTAKLYRFSSGKISRHKPLTVSKNTALTVQNKVYSKKGSVVKVPGNTQQYLLAKPKSYVYNAAGFKNNKQTAKRLAAASKKWSKGLTKSQVKAIRYYTDKGYSKINSALRFPDQAASNKVDGSISKINSAIATFNLSKPLTVYRGTSLTGLQKSLGSKSVKVGDSYRDAAYSSCTLSQMIALGFSSQHVVLKINLPAGHHGAYIDPISTNVGEKEYLLKSGSKLIVTNYQNAQSTVHTVITVKKHGHSAKHQISNVLTNYTMVTLNLKQ